MMKAKRAMTRTRLSSLDPESSPLTASNAATAMDTTMILSALNCLRKRQLGTLLLAGPTTCVPKASRTTTKLRPLSISICLSTKRQMPIGQAQAAAYISRKAQTSVNITASCPLLWRTENTQSGIVMFGKGKIISFSYVPLD